MIAARIDPASFQRVKTMILGLKAEARPALIRALNKTLAGVKTDTSAAIRADLNLAKRYVDKQIEARTNYQEASGRVDTRSKPVGLINFSGTRRTLKGASVKVKRAGSRSVIRHSFLATAKNAKNVFWRAKVEGKRVRRYPLERLTGPRLTDNLSRPEVIGDLEKKAGVRFDQNMEHELDRELAKYAG